MISNDSMFLNALMFKEKDTLALIFLIFFTLFCYTIWVEVTDVVEEK